MQYGLDISCFTTAIQVLVDFHVSRDIVYMCMSPTLAPQGINKIAPSEADDSKIISLRNDNVISSQLERYEWACGHTK